MTPSVCAQSRLPAPGLCAQGGPAHPAARALVLCSPSAWASVRTGATCSCRTMMAALPADSPALIAAAPSDKVQCVPMHPGRHCVVLCSLLPWGCSGLRTAWPAWSSSWSPAPLGPTRPSHSWWSLCTEAACLKSFLQALGLGTPCTSLCIMYDSFCGQACPQGLYQLKLQALPAVYYGVRHT